MQFSDDYKKSLRNLVKEFIEEYKDDTFDDDYKKANDFMINYTFGNKLGKTNKILDLEENYKKILLNLTQHVTN